MSEVEKLRRIPSHSNIVWLVGMADAGNGLVDGMILPFIEGVLLSEIKLATNAQKQKWKNQISDAIQFLHAFDVIWGDAKPKNIIVDRKEDKAILIDFEGGWTKGWVDQELSDKKEGDLQGCLRISNYINEIRATEVHFSRNWLSRDPKECASHVFKLSFLVKAG